MTATACGSDTVVSAGAGSVRATVTTTGVDRDANGYLLTVDRGTPVAVAPGGVLVFDGLSIGRHQLTVAGVQHNCVVDGGATRSVSVAANDTTEVAAAVTCAADPGVVGHSATDAAADTLPNSLGSPDPAVDVVASSVRYKGDSIVIVLHFRAPVQPASELASNSLFGAIEIDADESAFTGAASVVDFYGGSSGLGVDFVVDLFSATASSVTLLDVADESMRDVAATFGGDSMTVRFARGDLSGDDGNFAYASIVGTADRPTDLAPNASRYLARNPDAVAIVPLAGRSVGGTTTATALPSSSRALAPLSRTWPVPRRVDQPARQH